MDLHHHSFREFHQVAESANLPFNQTPATALGEISGFISLPIKRNARIFKLQTDQFSFQDLYRKPDEPKVDRYQHLCFEKALMGYLAAINKEDIQKVNSIINEHQKELRVDDYYTELTNLRPNSGFVNRQEDNLILSHFPTDLQWHLMDQLRIHAGSPERSLHGIDELANYLAQLQFIESKFPFDSGKIAIGFIWYHAWNPNIEITTSSIQYEKASVLFNIAALYSQLGAGERLSSIEGKQKAAKHFQHAAAILIHIRDVYCQRLGIQVSKSSEFDEVNLSSMATLMLAQAAECFMEKATSDSSTSQLIAIIAIYVSDLYEVAARTIRDAMPSSKGRFPKKIISQMNAKYNLYGAIAHFHTKVSTSNDRAVGERLTRLQLVKKLITLSLGYAQELGGAVLKTVESYAESFTTALVCLESANHDLYHNTPFDGRLLAPLRRPPRSIVNPEGLEEFLALVSSKSDILGGLMSSSNLITLQEVLSESRKLSHDGIVKVSSILEKARKPIPPLGNLPATEEETLKFKSLKIETKKLIEELHAHQKLEYQICTKDLVTCLQKIQRYTEANITEALNLVVDVLKVHPAKDSGSFLELRALKSSIKTKHNEIIGIKTAEQLHARYIKEISDFDARSWDEEKILSLFTILDSETGFSAILGEWTKADKDIEDEKKKINELSEKGSKMLEELRKLPAVAWADNKKYSFATNIAQRKEYMAQLDKSVKELGENLEKSYAAIKVDLFNQNSSEKAKKITEALTELKKEAKNVDEFVHTIQKCAKFRNEVIDAIQKYLILRAESCRLLYICLETKHGELKGYLKHCKIARDPYLTTILHNPEDDYLETKILSPKLNVEDLSTILKKTFILPLDTSVNRQDSFQKFWENVEAESKKKSTWTEERNIGSLSDIFEEIPRKIVVDTKSDLNIRGQRRFSVPGKAGTKTEHINIQLPTNGAEENENNDSGGGVLKGLNNIFRWIGGKPKRVTRSASLSSGHDTPSNHSADDKEEDMIAIIMNENVRLRNKLANTRKELTGRNKKVEDLEEKLVNLENIRKAARKTRIESRKQKIEIGTSSETSTSRDSDDKETNVYALAHGIVAGIQAANKAKRKGANPRNSVAKIETMMALGPILKLDDKGLESAIPFTRKKHSGVYSDPKTNIAFMKEENDQIAKILGK